MKNKTAQKLGKQGELYAKRNLERLGLNVLLTAELDLGYDLLINDSLKVEVKTARLNSRKKYQFCLTKRDHADIRKSDVVIFQCINSDGSITTFVVPTTIVANNKQLTVSGNLSNYKGSISQFRLA